MCINRMTILTIAIALFLLLAGCEEPGATDVVTTSDNVQSTTSIIVSSEENAAVDDTSETVSEEDVSSEEVPSEESATITSSEEETESETATSSKPAVTPAAHEHDYYRPKDAYKCIGEHRFGWVSEENYGIIHPTCTEQGFTVYVCSICGDMKFDNYTEPTGHTMDKIYYQYPTHKCEGYEEAACSKCGYREKTGVTYPQRLGDLSGIDEGIVLSDYDALDSFSYDTGYGNIHIDDFRLYECHVPEITIDHENQRVAITYDLEDGTFVTEYAYFPIVYDPNKEIQGIYFQATIKRDGTYRGTFTWWS